MKIAGSIKQVQLRNGIKVLWWYYLQKWQHLKQWIIIDTINLHKYLFTALRPLGGRGLVKLTKGLSDRSVTSHPPAFCKSSGCSLDEREYLSTRRGHKAPSHQELLIECHSPWLLQSSEVEMCCKWIIWARWSYHSHTLLHTCNTSCYISKIDQIICSLSHFLGNLKSVWCDTITL